MSPPLSAAEERASSTGEVRNRIRIVIADDHDLYRRGMQAVIGLEPEKIQTTLFQPATLAALSL